MDVLLYIKCVVIILAGLAFVRWIPYMVIQNYRRIKLMNKRLDRMCTGLGIMLGEDDEE